MADFGRFSQQVHVREQYGPAQGFTSLELATRAARTYALAHATNIFGTRVGPATAIYQAAAGYVNLALSSPLVAVASGSGTIKLPQAVHMMPGVDAPARLINGRVVQCYSANWA